MRVALSMAPGNGASPHTEYVALLKGSQMKCVRGFREMAGGWRRLSADVCKVVKECTLMRMLELSIMLSLKSGKDRSVCVTSQQVSRNIDAKVLMLRLLWSE